MAECYSVCIICLRRCVLTRHDSQRVTNRQTVVTSLPALHAYTTAELLQDAIHHSTRLVAYCHL